MALKKIPVKGYYFEVPETFSVVGMAAALTLQPATADVTVSKSVKVKPLKSIEGGKSAEMQSKIGELEANLKAAESESKTLQGQTQSANETAEALREELATVKGIAEETDRALTELKKATEMAAKKAEEKAAKKGK